MRFLIVLVLIFGLFAFAGCESGSDGTGDKTSRLEIRNALTSALVASGTTRGAITLDIDDTRTFDIIRVITDDSGASTTEDVTDEADFNFTDTDVAHMDANGELFADAVGFTTLTVKFREDALTEDIVELDITVEDATPLL
jgi:hypothetical protein